VFLCLAISDEDYERQVEQVQQYATHEGLHVVAWVAKSPRDTHDDRPGLDELLDLVRARSIDLVLVQGLEHVARTPSHALDLISELHTHGVALVSLTDGIDTSTEVGQYLVQGMTAMHDLEIRLRLGQAKRRVGTGNASGTSFGRPRRTLDLDKARRLLEGGMSVSRIARQMRVPRRTLSSALERDEAGDA
jgi:DNA invertase Pin-like site-specific DNA recombinase